MTKNEKLEALLNGLYPELKGIHKEKFIANLNTILNGGSHE